MVADDASSMDIEWTNSGGALRVANLVPVRINGVDPATEPIDLMGTIEWTCGSGSPRFARRERNGLFRLGNDV